MFRCQYTAILHDLDAVRQLCAIKVGARKERIASRGEHVTVAAACAMAASRQGQEAPFAQLFDDRDLPIAKLIAVRTLPLRPMRPDLHPSRTF